MGASFASCPPLQTVGDAGTHRRRGSTHVLRPSQGDAYGSHRPTVGRSEMTSWPGGARGAVAFTFDFDAEEVWIGDDPENATRPGVLSQGTYGAKVAVPLLLELLEHHG